MQSSLCSSCSLIKGKNWKLLSIHQVCQFFPLHNFSAYGLKTSCKVEQFNTLQQDTQDNITEVHTSNHIQHVQKVLRWINFTESAVAKAIVKNQSTKNICQFARLASCVSVPNPHLFKYALPCAVKMMMAFMQCIQLTINLQLHPGVLYV